MAYEKILKVIKYAFMAAIFLALYTLVVMSL